MSRRALTLLVSILAGGLVGGMAETAWADCTDTPITINFDAGSGNPHCYTESGMTVCAFQMFAPDLGLPADLALGDNDGNTSPDLMNHDIVGGTRTYIFSMGGAPLAVTGFDFVHFSGDHAFVSSKWEGGYRLTVSDTGFVNPADDDPEQWTGITSFTWTAEGAVGNPGGVMDNLAIVAQCCGNGDIDTGEQCEDGNTVDGDCCSATCQFEASGSTCEPNDGNICTADICDGAGSCTHPTFPNCDLTRPCGPLRPGGNPAFEHPKKASKFQSTLVQAFVSCGNPEFNSNVPDGTTEGGIPSCQVETPNERAGGPTNGWRWDETKGKGDISMKTICPGAADAALKLKLSGIVDGTGAPANGQGTLALTVRMTLNDPVGGDMTLDIGGQLSVTLLNGSGALSSTVGVLLSENGMPDIPNGTSIELRDAQVLDPNGNLFARSGVYLR